MRAAGSQRDWFFFDDEERDVVERALSAISAAVPSQGDVLEGVLSRLATTAALVRDIPSPSASWSALAGRPFSAESLVEALCHASDYDLDLHIPTKAVLGQAYLIAKINFFKALRHSLALLDAPAELTERLELEIGQSIHTKLAEELFISIVTDAHAAPAVKAGAARFLFDIWEDRLLVEVDDFAPALEAAWQARAKLRPLLGTLLGTQEVFRLFQEAYDHRFLEYFGDEHVETEQLLAFEEFLFGLSHEVITELRARLSTAGVSCVSLEDARSLVGSAVASWMPEARGSQALYTSYKKRYVEAAHRARTGMPGPKKTAEEYVMISFLRAEAGASRSTPPSEE